MINSQLISPRSIVVVGGSTDSSKPGGKVLKNLVDGNFRGPLYVINAKAENMYGDKGVKCFSSVDDCPNVELAIIAVSVKFTKTYMEELAAKKGVKAFIVLTAGFSEMGHEGKEIEKEIVSICERYKASLIGPNCIGVLTPHYNGVFAGTIPRLDPIKGCDFVSGSGATAVFIVDKGIPMGLSFSSIFSVGNSAQISVEDVIKYWDENYDSKTSSKVKLIYMETVQKPQLLLKHAKSLIQKGCKIAAIKAGNSAAGGRAASSHTGALATPDAAVDALFRKAGIIRCQGREELLLTASVLCHEDLKGKRVAIITHAGGPGVMLTDTLSNGGLEVPHLSGPKAQALLSKLYPGSSVANPIDFLATGTPEQLGHIIEAVEKDFDEIDAMVVIFGSPGLFDVKPVYKVLDEKMKHCKKPIYPVLPSVTTASEAVEYFKSLGRIYFSDEVSFGNTLVQILKTPKPETRETDEAAELGHDKLAMIRAIVTKAQVNEHGYLRPEDMQVLLDASGIKRAKEAVFKGSEKQKALNFSNEIGFPLVMKVVGPVHKTDVGGVVLNVMSLGQVEKEFDRLIALKEATSVLIQPMLKGTELFVGAKREEKFGHLILCGMGGIFIEVLKDTSSALAPVSKETAFSMIRSLKSYKIIKGVRGQKGINEEAFAEIITGLSRLLSAAPEILEVDLNPVLGNERDVVAVDARIRLDHVR